MAIRTGTVKSTAIKGGSGGVRQKHVNSLAKTPNARGHRPLAPAAAKASPIRGRDGGSGGQG